MLLQRVALVLFVVSLIVNIVRVFAVAGEAGPWIEVVGLLPIYVILPLIQPALPLLWIVSNQ